MKQTNQSNSLRVIISGGGTGGHIFPAIAIADAIRRERPDAEILFVGANNRMEMDKVPAAGYRIEGLPVRGLLRPFYKPGNIGVLLDFVKSKRMVKKIIRNFNPDIAIGVGGYASGPTLKAAIALGVPTLIQEQNSFPGVTNKMLAKKVNCICTGYDAMDKFFPEEKLVYTGNPLRMNMVNTEGKRNEAAAFFGLPTDRMVALLVGGSQGALGMNKGVSAKLAKLKESNISLIWQTGKFYYEQAVKEVEALGMQDIVKPMVFIDRMDLAYALADVVLSRAGAMSISELSIVGKAVIFVPLPTAAEDHQTKNAQRLVDAEAALMVANAETEEKLIPTLIAFAADGDQIAQMENNIRTFARPDAAKVIVEQILKIVGK